MRTMIALVSASLVLAIPASSYDPLESRTAASTPVPDARPQFTSSTQDDSKAAGSIAEFPGRGMLPGIVMAVDQVMLSVPVDGVISQIEVAEGDIVCRGQLLAAVDHRIAAASVRLAEVSAAHISSLEQARRQLTMMERSLDRTAQAYQRNAASDQELDQARMNSDAARHAVKQAEERLELARAQLELEQTRLASHIVLAPFDGRVTRIIAHVGQSMTRNDELLHIADARRLRVDLHVSHEFLGRMHSGSVHLLEADRPVNRQLTAILTSADKSIDAATGTFRCVFQIENSEESLPAGFMVRLANPSSSHGPAADPELTAALPR